MFLSFNRNERRRERRAELLRLNKEAEKKLRGEKVVEEKKLSETAEAVKENKNVVVFFCEYKPSNPVLIIKPALHQLPCPLLTFLKI